MKGEAEAFAIEAKASAEAEQMAKKADAWKEYREAAVVDMVLETMPKVGRCPHPPPPLPPPPPIQYSKGWNLAFSRAAHTKVLLVAWFLL